MEKHLKFLKRFYELIGEKGKFEAYLIKITFSEGIVAESLNEHKVYQNFKNSTNRYTYHPEQKNPPVRAHYQVYPSNSKKELYSVCKVDGKAHHKKNRGYQIPKKEAEEFRSLGVPIPPNNILERKSIDEFLDLKILNEGVDYGNVIYLLFS